MPVESQESERLVCGPGSGGVRAHVLLRHREVRERADLGQLPAQGENPTRTGPGFLLVLLENCCGNPQKGHPDQKEGLHKLVSNSQALLRRGWLLKGVKGGLNARSPTCGPGNPRKKAPSATPLQGNQNEVVKKLWWFSPMF